LPAKLRHSLVKRNALLVLDLLLGVVNTDRCFGLGGLYLYDMIRRVRWPLASGWSSECANEDLY
jgi:hypothetical protein